MPRWVWALRLTGLGFYVGTSIVVGLVGGVWLDRAFHTGILFTIVGLVLGVAVAFYGVFQLVKPLMGGDNKQRGE